jgi:hypothetical protein
MDERAPSPFSPPAVAYNPAYQNPDPYAGGYPRGTANPTAPATGTTLSADLLDAKRAHERGTVLYMLGWILIGVAVPVLAIAIGLIASNLGQISGGAQDAFVAALALLAAGISIRGVGFALMLKADFLIRGHAWLGSKSS